MVVWMDSLPYPVHWNKDVLSFVHLSYQPPITSSMANVKKVEPNPKVENKKCDQKRTMLAIINTIKPMLFVEYLYGIHRFYFIKGQLRPPNWIMRAYAVIHTGSFLVLFFAFLNFPAVFSGSMKIVEIMDEFPPIVVLIEIMSSTIIATFVVNTVNISIFIKLAAIDAKLQAESLSDFYKKSRFETYVLLLALSVSHFINSVIDFVTADVITIKGMIVLPLYFVQKLETFTFCKYMYMVKRRLTIVNDYLRAFVEEQEKNSANIFTVTNNKVEKKREVNFIGRASESNTKIRDLATMYDIIGKICHMINKVFNFQIFMTLVSTFTYVVITIWTSLYYYRKPGSNLGELINTAVWCCSAIYTVGIMSVSCERLLLVRNETRVLVNKVIMNYDLPKTMRVQAKAFMELVEAWPLRIYIYDMFSVDITLMLKFISVATTYLIVIIQISHFV
nr:uncharacterized protein LOC110372649 [Helicoverpa armigera]